MKKLIKKVIDYIQAKKGKVRYNLIVVKDKDLKTVFNIGRHFEQEPIISIR